MDNRADCGAKCAGGDVRQAASCGADCGGSVGEEQPNGEGASYASAPEQADCATGDDDDLDTEACIDTDADQV